MPVVGYAAGWLVLLAVTAPAVWAAVEARRLLLPGWAGSWAALVWIIGSASFVLVDAELAGTVGLLRPAPLAISSVVLWSSLAMSIRRRPRGNRPHDAPVLQRPDSVALALAAAGVVAVVSQWMAWTLAALRRGITGVDALLYHSSFAARFAQTGSITRLQPAVPGQAMTFYPANVEVIHAIGMVAFRRDIVSPFVNVAALLVALLAAWGLGRRWGSAPVAIAGVSLIAAAPYFAYSAAGTTLNDAPALAALLCSVALLTRAREAPGSAVFAALAAGLAVGTKLSFLAPALIVAASAVWLAPGRRVATAVGWLAAMGTTGGYWFARNLLRIGNPLPGVPLGLPSPRFPLVDRYGDRLLTSFRPGRWSTVYHHGLHDYFGRPWFFITLGLLAGLVVGLRSGGLSRTLAVMGMLAFAAYALTPISGDPLFFKINVRYAIAAQALVALAVATARWLRGVWSQRVLVAGAVVCGAFAFPGPAASADVFALPAWPPGSWHRVAAVAVVVASLALIASIAVTARRAAVRVAISTTAGLAAAASAGVVAAGLAAAASVGVVVAGYPVADRFAAARYQRLPGELGPAWHWAQGVRRARIGVAGVYLQYPFTGPDLSNVVQYVGIETAHHGFADAPSCRAWRAAVNRGRYTVIVTSRDSDLLPLGEPPAARWTRSDPAALLVLQYSHTSVFRLTGPLHPTMC